MNKTKRKYKGGWCFREGTAIDQAKSVILDAGLHGTKHNHRLDSMIDYLKQKKNCDKYPVFIHALKFINKKSFKNLTQDSFRNEGLTKYTRYIDKQKLFESYGEEFYNRHNKPIRLEESVYKSYLKYILEKLGEIDQDSELGLTASVKYKHRPSSSGSDGSDGSDESTTTSTTTSTTSSNDSGNSDKKKIKPQPKRTNLHSGASVLSTVNPNGESFGQLNVVKITPDTAHSSSGARGQSSRGQSSRGQSSRGQSSRGQSSRGQSSRGQSSSVHPVEGGKSKRNNRSNNKTKRKYKK